MKNHKQDITRVLNAIEANLEYIDMDEIIKVSGFSYYHFHRIFQSSVGENLKKYVVRLRLEKAAMKIQHGNQSMTDLAFEAGFECSSSFNKAFKKMFGTSPTLYKQQKHYLLQEIAMIKPKRIENIKPISVYSARNLGPYDSCGAAWETLMKFAYTQKFKQKKNLMGKQTRMFGISYDDPNTVASENLRYDACITKDDTANLDEGIQEREISGGKYVVFLHKGPYNNLSETYSSAYKYIIENHEIRDVPTFEEYLNRDPRRTKPENLKTEIWIPVK